MVHAVNGVSLATSFFFYDRLLFASVIARVSDYSSSILPQLLNVDIFWLGKAKLVRVMAILLHVLSNLRQCLPDMLKLRNMCERYHYESHDICDSPFSQFQQHSLLHLQSP